MFPSRVTRNGFKIKILVQYQGEIEFQPVSMLNYVESLKRRLNAEIEPKDNFEAASDRIPNLSLFVDSPVLGSKCQRLAAEMAPVTSEEREASLKFMIAPRHE